MITEKETLLKGLKSLLKKTGQNVPYCIFHDRNLKLLEELIQSGDLKVIDGKNGFLQSVVLNRDDIYCVEEDDDYNACFWVRYYLGGKPSDLGRYANMSVEDVRKEFKELEIFSEYDNWLLKNKTKLENMINLEVEPSNA